MHSIRARSVAKGEDNASKMRAKSKMNERPISDQFITLMIRVTVTHAPLRMDTGTFGLTRTRTRKNRTRVRAGSKTCTGYPRVLNTPAGPQTRRVYPQNFQNK
jgi:hypothetical protein